ncbi:MAG: IPT/TIG domain-containing protein [Gaiellaceae bacterium]
MATLAMGAWLTASGVVAATGPPPTITGFTPASGAAGTAVTITGTNFTGATAVAFNGTSATFTVASATQINTTVPAGAGSGPITVTTPDGTASSTGGQVSFVSVGVSRITSGATSLALTLPSGYQAGDLLVAWLSFGDNAQAISGMTGWTELPWSPLDDGTLWHARAFYKIAVSGEVAPTVRWTNNTKAIFQTGAWRGVNQASPIVASGGALDLTSNTSVAGPAVTNTLANAWAVAFFSFRTTNSANKTMTFSSFTPAGLTARADSNLSAAASAAWEDVATADSGGPVGTGSHKYTGLTTAASGSGHKAASLIYVAPTAGGGGNFTVTGAAPTITSFTPTSGAAGTAVTITGTNLSGATAVAFNGTSATYTVASATQINTTVPATAASGPITVTTPNGTATSTSNFTVAGAPTTYRVYTGYYDTHHTDIKTTKPSPWITSPNVVFVATPDSPSGGWDSSTVRIENLGATPLTNVVVSVDIGSQHFALWGTNTIPVGNSLILAQTSFQNFDGSDTSPAGCYGCDPMLCLTSVSSTIPVVHVTVNGQVANLPDSNRVLNTGGVDSAGCPDTGFVAVRREESVPWQALN